MAPKKARETNTSVARFTFHNLVNELGRLILKLICSFYLLLFRYAGEGIYTVIHVLFGMFREVLKILLVLVARVFSEICFALALIVEKIVAAILHMLLLLVVKGRSFIDEATRGLVDLAGHAVSSIVFITITVFILWLIVPVLEEVGHAILFLF